MTVKETVKQAILTLENLCQSFETPSGDRLEALEEVVDHLNSEVQRLNLASDLPLKKELGTLQNTLGKLSSLLIAQQENLARQAQELSLQQRALRAYTQVANNNLGIMA